MADFAAVVPVRADMVEHPAEPGTDFTAKLARPPNFPPLTSTLGGTVAIDVLLLETATPVSARVLVSTITVAVDVPPDATSVGDNVSDITDAELTTKLIAIAASPSRK